MSKQIPMHTPHFPDISRRDFLKLSAYGLLGTLLPAPGMFDIAQPISLGRVMDEKIYSYDLPSFQGYAQQEFRRDAVVDIFGVEIGDKFPFYNQAWYQVLDGEYIHSTQLQPVRDQVNLPDPTIPNYGILSEVTVPLTDAFSKPIRDSQIAYRYYYGSTHWINKLIVDVNDQAWYRVSDDQNKSKSYYVPAEHLRVIPEEEISPLSPQVPLSEKRVEVYSAQQMMIAYEGDTPVNIVQVSLGDKGKNTLWRTPLGEFKSFYKRPSRHMAAGNLAFGDYDLPGVPWVSYITSWGIAFHGTYWHNDFGRPRSHGCINMPPASAKWLYRWTQPDVPYDMELKYNPGYGTRVDIF